MAASLHSLRLCTCSQATGQLVAQVDRRLLKGFWHHSQLKSAATGKWQCAKQEEIKASWTNYISRCWSKPISWFHLFIFVRRVQTTAAPNEHILTDDSSSFGHLWRTWCSCSVWKCLQPSDIPDRAGWHRDSLPPTGTIQWTRVKIHHIDWCCLYSILYTTVYYSILCALLCFIIRLDESHIILDYSEWHCVTFDFCASVLSDPVWYPSILFLHRTPHSVVGKYCVLQLTYTTETHMWGHLMFCVGLAFNADPALMSDLSRQL